ncbi:MAG: type 4a pilus biogenesis protein PilO [Candidatus Spechtbacterales bacterium]
MKHAGQGRTMIYTALVVLAGVVFVGAAALIQFAVLPLMAAQDSFAAQSRTFSELQEKASVKQELMRELALVEEERDIFERALLSANSQLDFFERLERIAAATRNTYTLREPKEVERGSMRLLSLGIELEGSYADLIRFLREVRSLPYVITTRSVIANAATNGRVTSTIIMEVFLK